MKCSLDPELTVGEGRTFQLLLPLRLGDPILNESSGHINDGVLVRNNVDTKLLLDLQ